MPTPENEAEQPVPAAMIEAAPIEGIDDQAEPAITKALIVVGNHRFAKDDKRFKIVVEAYGFTEDGVTPVVKPDGYPAGADLYYGTDPTVIFPKDAKEVIILGYDVAQLNFWGFSPDPAYVCVGPASPAYGAANIAAQRGATQIEIIGLSDAEKERLKPFLADLPTNLLAPSSVKIDLT